MIIEFNNSMTVFSLRGRASKKEYRNFLLNWIICSILLLFVCVVCYIVTFNIQINFSEFAFVKNAELSLIPFIFLVVFSSVFIIFQLSSLIFWGIITVKRLHDLNISGVCFWVLAVLPVVLGVSNCGILNGFLLYVILGGILFLSFADGYPFSNKYDIIDNEEEGFFKKLVNGKISIF